MLLFIKNVKNRGGNRSISAIPGKDFTKNYAITLKDIDTSILNHVKNVMRPSVKEAGEMIKVPVMYGNEERWFNIRKRGVVRDSKGSLLAPLIVARRTAVAKNTTTQQSFSHDVEAGIVTMIRASKWS